ncbi:unnamed protein product [Pleuronectes platessa]|uniref:Uncharacterized protein n=1 Tax=Pleuronectes platessa TaxID=8262 RepID=A0A9N7V2R9_PLEPL|nr:unnamed protein product [Pleuronectes platessa]
MCWTSHPVLSATVIYAYPGMITDAMFCAGYLEEERTLARVTPVAPSCCTVSCRVLCPGATDGAEYGNLVSTPRVCLFNDWLESTMASY